MRTTVNAELNDHLIAKITSFIKPFYNMAFLKGKEGKKNHSLIVAAKRTEIHLNDITLLCFY